MVLKFYTSVAKRLKVKVSKFWALIHMFVKLQEGKLVTGRGSFCLPPTPPHTLIPSWIGLKYLAKHVSPILSELFNGSMSTGVFPNHMKLAMITPVYKGGSKLDISNYQPVSTLPILSKFLEIVQVRLTKFLNKHY